MRRRHYHISPCLLRFFIARCFAYAAYYYYATIATSTYLLMLAIDAAFLFAIRLLPLCLLLASLRHAFATAVIIAIRCHGYADIAAARYAAGFFRYC